MLPDLVTRQQEEIEVLREKVRQLEEALTPTNSTVEIEWLLTSREARVFAHLTTREMATKQSVMAALYSDRPDEEPEIKIVDVFICKMRKKLRPFGIVIDTVWGQGYSLRDYRNYQARAA